MKSLKLSLLEIFALGAAAMPVSSAAAAESPECVVELIGEQRKAEFFTAYRADARPSEALQAALRAAMQACIDTHGWNQAQQDAVKQYSTARILYDQLILTSPFGQADLERLATAFDTVDDATALRWFQQGIQEADNERLAAVLAQSGVAVDERNGPFVGEFFAARYMAITSRAAFIAL